MVFVPRPSSLVSQSKGVLEGTVDTLYHASVARKVALLSGLYVRTQIRNAFFADPNGAFVEVDGKQYRVLYPRSHLVDNLFRLGTGSTLTEQINTLPFGVKHVSDFARQKMEAMIVNHVIGLLAQWTVEEHVERALLASYGYGKEKIDQLIGSYYQSDVFLQSFQLNPLQTAFQDMKLNQYEEENIAKANAAMTDFESKSDITGQTEQEGITFRDVSDYYHDQIVEYLNGFIEETLVEGIARASSTVAKKTTSKLIKQIQPIQLATLIVAGIPGKIVGLAVFGALQHYQSAITDFTSDLAFNRVKNLGNRVSPHFRKTSNWLTSKEEKFEDQDFVVLEKKTATLSAWASQAVRPAAQYLFSAYNPGYKPWDVKVQEYHRPLNPNTVDPMYGKTGHELAEMSEEEFALLEEQTQAQLETLSESQYQEFYGLQIDFHKDQVKDHTRRGEVAADAALQGRERLVRLGLEKKDESDGVFSKVKNLLRWW